MSMRYIVSKKVLLIILLLSIALFVFAWKGYRSLSFTSAHFTHRQAEKLSQQFVDDREAEGFPLSPYIHQMKETAARVLGEDISKIRLRATTPQILLLSIETNTGWNDVLLDLVSNGKTFVSTGGIFSIKLNDTICYIDRTKILYYKLGQRSFLVLPGSQLKDVETYMSTIDSYADLPSITHADDSITVSVYDTTEQIQDLGTIAYRGQKKLRDVTYHVP